MYIQAANQISVQKPLTDEWFDNPVYYDEKRVASVDPKFADYLSPLMSRRMCSLLKRDVILSRKTLNDAGIEMPDAIICGTGLGCIENTEKFLCSIKENREQFLQPTFFMQSTHNILSTTVAIELKCHGYNNTYVNRGTSFENALFDAYLQFSNKRINTALVGGYDELTDNYNILFNRVGTFDFNNGNSPKQKCFASEIAVSMLLENRQKPYSLCKIDAIELMFRPSSDMLQKRFDEMLSGASCELSDIDAVMLGINTVEQNDEIYKNVAMQLFPDKPLMQYKHIFGESFSSSAMAVYVAAGCLKKGRIPAFLLSDVDTEISAPKRILIYNHYKNKSHSFILLSSC